MGIAPYLLTLAVANIIVLTSGCRYITSPNRLNNSQTDGFIITSPGYPQPGYSNHQEVCWLFTVDSGNITITPKDVILEQCCDRVRIYDGINTNATSIGSFGGIRRGISVRNTTTKGRFMLVRFKSDYSISGPGFQACVCPTNSLCNCSYINTTTMWSNWNGWNEWYDWDGFEPHYDHSLSAGAKAGIGIAILLAVVVPIIIGVSVACCCGGKCKKTTPSPDDNAERRRRAMVMTQNSSFTDINAAAEIAADRDRKHNHVRPWIIPHPPANVSFSQPPGYNQPGYGSPHEMIMAPPMSTAATNRSVLPPVGINGTPLAGKENPGSVPAAFVVGSADNGDPPCYTEKEIMMKRETKA